MAEDLAGVPLDPTTAVGQLRINLGDAVQNQDGTYDTWGDAQLNQFLTGTTGNVYLATSNAWAIIAGNWADQAAKITRTDQALDLTSRAVNARALADYWAKMAITANGLAADQTFALAYPYRSETTDIPPELGAWPYYPGDWDLNT